MLNKKKLPLFLVQSYQPHILVYLPFIKGLCVTCGRVRVSKRKTGLFQRFTVVARCFKDIDKMTGDTAPVTCL